MMVRLPGALIAIIACTACAPDAPSPYRGGGTAGGTAAPGNREAPGPTDAAGAAPTASSRVDPRSPEAARRLLDRYAALLGEGRFGEARRLWSDEGRASGMDDVAFARLFAGYAAIRAEIGPAGRMEGAAGSTYVEIPLRLTGSRDDGSAFSTAGTATLRRVNDVPGSSPEQRAWRIYRLDLQPPL